MNNVFILKYGFPHLTILIIVENTKAIQGAPINLIRNLNSTPLVASE